MSRDSRDEAKPYSCWYINALVTPKVTALAEDHTTISDAACLTSKTLPSQLLQNHISHETARFAKRTAVMLGTALGLNPALNVVGDRLSQRSLLSRCCDDRKDAQISRIPAIFMLRFAQEADQTRLSAPHLSCGRSQSRTTMRWGRVVFRRISQNRFQLIGSTTCNTVRFTGFGRVEASPSLGKSTDEHTSAPTCALPFSISSSPKTRLTNAAATSTRRTRF